MLLVSWMSVNDVQPAARQSQIGNIGKTGIRKEWIIYFFINEQLVKMINRLLGLTLIAIVAGQTMLLAQSKPFVPADFTIPEILETSAFKARMLTVNHVVKDYDAVMTSIDHLKGVFGPKSKWPSTNLTFEQDLIDLGWHQKEFQTRRSFAYTIVKPDESQVAGCLYINPTSKAG